jgi:hypothetical protein
MASSIITQKQLTQKRLHELLSYNESEGNFYWRVSKGGVKAGALAGDVDHKGYHRIMIDRKTYATHRLVFLYVTGEFPAEQVDHIDGNPINNRIENLRQATNAQNRRNVRISKSNKSGYKGVCWNKRSAKWVAVIKKDKQHHFLGYFNDVIDAHNAVKNARESLHGEFANHG